MLLRVSRIATRRAAAARRHVSRRASPSPSFASCWSISHAASATATAAAAAAALTFASATTAAAAAPLSADDPLSLSPVDMMDITARVSERIDLPFVPAAWEEIMVAEIVSATLESMREHLSPDLKRRIFVALEASEDGISKEEEDVLVEEIIAQMPMAHAKLPLLNDEQKMQLVRGVLSVILGDCSAGGVARGAVGNALALATEYGAKGGMAEGKREALVVELNNQVG